MQGQLAQTAAEDMSTAVASQILSGIWTIGRTRWHELGARAEWDLKTSVSGLL